MRITQVTFPIRQANPASSLIEVAADVGVLAVIVHYVNADGVPYVLWPRPGSDGQRFTEKRRSELIEARGSYDQLGSGENRLRLIDQRPTNLWALPDDRAVGTFDPVALTTAITDTVISRTNAKNDVVLPLPAVFYRDRIAWDRVANAPVRWVMSAAAVDRTYHQRVYLPGGHKLIGRSDDLLWCVQSGWVRLYSAETGSEVHGFDCRGETLATNLLTVVASRKWFVVASYLQDVGQPRLRVRILRSENGQVARTMEIPLPELPYYTSLDRGRSFISDETVLHVFVPCMPSTDYRGRGRERSKVGAVVSVDLDD